MDVRFKDAALNGVLEAELAAGNEVAEVSGWPPKCEKLIILAYKFSRHYELASLDYREPNDPHYWFAEYEAAEGGEVLACRFKPLPA